MSKSVLLIEDDARIREIVERGLGARGFGVRSAGDGAAGVALVAARAFDLVLLDLLLPDERGLEVLRRIRALEPRLPVVALTALDDMRSKCRGLDAGADDYITKPFSIEELAARIRARLRQGDKTALTAGPFALDLASHTASLGDRSVRLSAREVSLLAAFLRQPGRVLTREQLLETVWQIDFDPGSNVVDVYVSALRRKLGPDLIETVRGVGYRLTVAEADGR
jgi:DNA-binding response OmpR family regulator